jgi:rubrerythrin
VIETNCEQTIFHLFEHAIAIEYKAAEMYCTFSRLFSHVPEISAFWTGLEQDEMFHMETLVTLLDGLRPDEYDAPVDKQLWENMVAVHDLINGNLAISVSNLNDAYEVAHELEFSEINGIFKFLTIEAITSEEQGQFMRDEITKHERKLIDFGDTFGDKAWRLKIAIQQLSTEEGTE